MLSPLVAWPSLIVNGTTYVLQPGLVLPEFSGDTIDAQTSYTLTVIGRMMHLLLRGTAAGCFGGSGGNFGNPSGAGGGGGAYTNGEEIWLYPGVTYTLLVPGQSGNAFAKSLKLSSALGTVIELGGGGGGGTPRTAGAVITGSAACGPGSLGGTSAVDPDWGGQGQGWSGNIGPCGGGGGGGCDGQGGQGGNSPSGNGGAGGGVGIAGTGGGVTTVNLGQGGDRGISEAGEHTGGGGGGGGYGYRCTGMTNAWGGGGGGGGQAAYENGNGGPGGRGQAGRAQLTMIG